MEGKTIMKQIWMLLVLVTTSAFALDIIPVSKWPKYITDKNKSTCDPTPDQCVAVGYRLLPTSKPTTPTGMMIVSEAIIQDPTNSHCCAYSVTYTNEPPPPRAPPAPVYSTVTVSSLSFVFDTNNSPVTYFQTSKPSK